MVAGSLLLLLMLGVGGAHHDLAATLEGRRTRRRSLVPPDLDRCSPALVLSVRATTAGTFFTRGSSVTGGGGGGVLGEG